MTRWQRALDYTWPIVLTVCSLLPRRLLRHVRDTEEPEIVG